MLLPFLLTVCLALPNLHARAHDNESSNFAACQSEAIEEDSSSHTSLLQTSLALQATAKSASLTAPVNARSTEPAYADSASSRSGSLLTKPELPNGNNIEQINAKLLQIMVFVAGCTGLAFLLGLCIPAGSWGKDRPQPWALGLLASSYALLIPGFRDVMLSFKFSVQVMGKTFVLTSSCPGCEPSAISESFFGFIKLMFETGGHLGAYLIILYAIVIPALKLTFLAIGEFWRYSPDKNKLWIARHCILTVQRISKWACPDLFVYILLLYLIRQIDGTVHILAPAHLDTGFTCFAMFCILSSTTALTIKTPAMPAEVEQQGAGGRRGWASWVLDCVGYETYALLSLFLAGCIFIFLALGITWPCLGLRLNANLFVKPHGPLPEFMQPILDRIDIPSYVNSDVSLVRCTRTLHRWTVERGELNCGLAFVLLSVFGFAVTILDVVALVAAGFSLKSSRREANFAMQVSHILRHLSMLDVCIMGLFVSSLAATVYKQQGVSISLMPGFFMLVIGEALHYMLYYVLSYAVEEAEEERKLGSPFPLGSPW